MSRSQTAAMLALSKGIDIPHGPRFGDQQVPMFCDRVTQAKEPTLVASSASHRGRTSAGNHAERSAGFALGPCCGCVGGRKQGERDGTIFDIHGISRTGLITVHLVRSRIIPSYQMMDIWIPEWRSIEVSRIHRVH